MSALCRLCLRFFVVICISVSTTLCSKVEWRNPGESITIKCECKEDALLFLNVKKGLQKDVDIFYQVSGSDKAKKAYANRMQHYGTFPNFQILLKNLTSNDTGAYWCMYRTAGKEVEGMGSMLLIVRDPVLEMNRSADPPQSCNSHQNLVLIFVIVSSIMLFATLMTLLLLAFRKIKNSHMKKNKPRPIPRNDVYEDMRATIRR